MGPNLGRGVDVAKFYLKMGPTLEPGVDVAKLYLKMGTILGSGMDVAKLFLKKLTNSTNVDVSPMKCCTSTHL